MKELKCPYCEFQNNVRDDCYEPETPYEAECDQCGKIFGFTIQYWPTYSEYKLPCANGKPHDYKPIKGFPLEQFKNSVKCSYCGDIRLKNEIKKIKKN